MGEIITGDVLEALRAIPDESVDCCVTSPPYYALRDYGADGQIGLEDTPEEYIDKLVEVFREVRRVLRPDGTLWLNIGDTYATKTGRNPPNVAKEACGKRSRGTPRGYKYKDLIGIPWALAFALRADGWYLRQDIIWNKTNAMPENARDRCAKSHEYIFLLSKEPKYYFDFEAIKEPAVGFSDRAPRGSRGTLRPNSGRRKGNARTFRGGGGYTGGRSFSNAATINRESHGNVENTTGKRNRRSVWNVATQGFSGAHFATFPETLIEPCVLAGCREGGTVLDPFMGSGTTAVVAVKHNRDYVGIDINPDYAEMARQRVAETEEGLLLAAGRKKHGRNRPPYYQITLFEEEPL